MTLLLKQSMPNKKQIQFWDKVLVRGSKLIDPLVLHLVGKSLLGIWQKPVE